MQPSEPSAPREPRPDPDVFLVSVAHPDDEVLGFGGAASRLTARGHVVRAVIACGTVGARAHRPSDDDLVADMMKATEILGMGEPILGSFPNIQMNTVPHLELVQFVEDAIVETGANRILTTHPGDLNDDHRQVSAATQAAARLSQRRSDVPALRSLHYVELLSSTEWAFRGGQAFEADSFLEIGEDGLEAKTRALEAYRDVMRPFPHPRSPEILRGLAAYRGGQAGLHYAEAFQTAYAELGAWL